MRRSVQIFFILAVSLAACLSLAIRIQYRGPYYPGWDLMGATKGYFLLSTQGLWKSIVDIEQSTRNFQYWNPGNSLFLSLIPGSLNLIYPSQYWSHGLTFFIAVGAMIWLAKFLRANVTTTFLLILGALTSPALVSFSITGYQYISGIIPYCMALSIVFWPRLHTNILVNFLVTLLTLECSWHFYEVGKLAFVVFIIASIFLKDLPRHAKTTWLVLSATHVVHLAYFARDNIKFFATPARSEYLLHLEFGQESWRQLGQGNIFTPFLLVAAILSLKWISTNRRFWRVLWIFQVTMVAWILFKGAFQFRARRLLTLEFFSLLTCGLFLMDAQRARWNGHQGKKAAAICAIFVVGFCMQFLQLLQFVSQPAFVNRHSLPGTFSQQDYIPFYEGIEASQQAVKIARSGAVVISPYGPTAHPENSTDPAGIIQRIYLTIGHKLFFEKFAFLHSSIPYHFILPLIFQSPFAENISIPQNSNLDVWLMDYVDKKEEAYQQNRNAALALIAKTFPIPVKPDFKIGRFLFYRLHVGASGS